MIKRTNHERKEIPLSEWKARLILLFGEENVYFRDSGPVFTRELSFNDKGPVFLPPKFSHHIIEAVPMRNNPIPNQYLLGQYNVTEGIGVIFFDNEDVG